MEKKIQEAKLKDGNRVGYVNVDGTSIMINNKLSQYQFGLLVFIIVASILLTYVSMSFISEGFNEILYEIYEIKSHLGIVEPNTGITFINYDEQDNLLGGS